MTPYPPRACPLRFDKTSSTVGDKKKSYKNGQKCCQLCLTEKLFIIKCSDKNLLNSR